MTLSDITYSYIYSSRYKGILFRDLLKWQIKGISVIQNIRKTLSWKRQKTKITFLKLLHKNKIDNTKRINIFLNNKLDNSFLQ